MNNIRLYSYSLAAAIATSFLPVGHLSAEVNIVNGSFEAPVETAPITLGGGDGWTRATLGKEYILTDDAQDLAGDYYGSTPYGLQFLGLNPRTNGFLAVDSQTVSGFTTGGSYLLTFYLADAASGANPTVTVSLDQGSTNPFVTQDFTATIGGPYGQGALIPFITETLAFTAPYDTIGFHFTNTGASTILIDNVSLTTLGVPEPTTNAMLLVGAVVFVGTVARGRRMRPD